MIISFMNRKGGVGKTTNSVAMACELSLMGSRVLLVDADPQQSIKGWYSARPDDKPVDKNLFIISLVGKKLHMDVNRLLPDYDHIIIDTPGHADDRDFEAMGTVKSAALVSHVCVVPTLCSATSIRSTRDMIHILKSVTSVVSDTRIRILLNRVDKRTSMRRRVDSILSDLIDDEVKLLDTVISLSVNFEKADALGLSLDELKEDTSKERSEIISLIKEVTEV
jgi:chromosome partitioning protein